MKMRNGFFSFSMTAMAVLTLSLAMTTALLAVSSLQMVAIYEKKVRLHYLADSAVREGWQEVQQNPLPYFNVTPWPCLNRRSWPKREKPSLSKFRATAGICGPLPSMKRHR